MVNLFAGNSSGAVVAVSESSTENAFDVHHAEELLLTKEEVQRRCKLLLQRAEEKVPDPEDALPGDKTTKYALRYRNREC